MYKCLDSGISSQETIYSIAPAAKPREIETKFDDILDIRAPANAPIPVVIPEIIVINIDFRDYIELNDYITLEEWLKDDFNDIIIYQDKTFLYSKIGA